MQLQIQVAHLDNFVTLKTGALRKVGLGGQDRI